VGFRVTYAPGVLRVRIDGEALEHRVPALVTAPSQVTAGENRIDVKLTEPRFTGKIEPR
jgi:hypothetical protein